MNEFAVAPPHLRITSKVARKTVAINACRVFRYRIDVTYDPTPFPNLVISIINIRDEFTFCNAKNFLPNHRRVEYDSECILLVSIATHSARGRHVSS